MPRCIVSSFLYTCRILDGACRFLLYISRPLRRQSSVKNIVAKGPPHLALLFTSRARRPENLTRYVDCVLFIKSLFVPARLLPRDGTKFNLSVHIPYTFFVFPRSFLRFSFPDCACMCACARARACVRICLSLLLHHHHHHLLLVRLLLRPGALNRARKSAVQRSHVLMRYANYSMARRRLDSSTRTFFIR